MSRLPHVSILGWYGNENAGDEAILTVLLADLSRSIPGIKCSVFSATPEKTAETYGVSSTQKKLNQEFIFNSANYSKSDLLIIGGGTLTKNDPVSMLPIWFCMGIAIICRTRFLLYAQGVERLANPIARWMTRFFVNQASLITLREEFSRRSLIEVGVGHSIGHPKMIVTGDPGINLQSTPVNLNSALDQNLPPEAVEQFLSKPIIGICPKANTCTSNQSVQALESEFAKLADNLINQLHVSILFVPMQNSGFHDDYSSANRIIREMQNSESAKIIRGDYNPSELKGILAQLDLVMAMRLHALIFAASAYVPVIGISYAEKITYFLETIDQAEWNVDLETFSAALLSQKVNCLWPQRDLIQQSLKRNIICYKARAATTIGYIEQLFQPDVTD
ncbi:MAG: hypothetical protein HC825_05355 [Oscillatoriales cyanobacterium RM1_1_9]|nr:hypothetical protein [Oscillatoriales cyanobacterium RM1_1_9]